MGVPGGDWGCWFRSLASLPHPLCLPLQCGNLMLVEVIPKEPLSFSVFHYKNPKLQHTVQVPASPCLPVRLTLVHDERHVPDGLSTAFWPPCMCPVWPEVLGVSVSCER